MARDETVKTGENTSSQIPLEYPSNTSVCVSFFDRFIPQTRTLALRAFFLVRFFRSLSGDPPFAKPALEDERRRPRS